MTRINTIPMILPISFIADGLPRHNVSSTTGFGAVALVIGTVPAGEGRPQCGQTGASVETSLPQSGQAMTGMAGDLTASRCRPATSVIIRAMKRTLALVLFI